MLNRFVWLSLALAGFSGCAEPSEDVDSGNKSTPAEADADTDTDTDTDTDADTDADTDSDTDADSDTDTDTDADARVVINEVLAGASDDSSDWVELYNAGPGDADVGGWHLTDDPELAVEEAWTIPDGTAIVEGGYLVIYASDGEGSEDDGPHATFKISKGGETLVFYASTGEVVDTQEIPELEDDESYMRTTDGGEDWVVTDRPTKGAENRN